MTAADTSRTCLIVDDSAVIRKVARRIVENMQFNVEEAEHGRDALDYCRRRMPDAVLVDWHMPVMTGVEFVRALRRSPGGDTPTVIFCTTENDPQEIAEALRSGANEYILKPFDTDIMTSKFAEVGLV